MQIDWQDSNIERVARVLQEINPRGGTVEGTIKYIKNMATANMDEAGFMGTGGWYVSLAKLDYPDDDFTHTAKVTLMAYSVERYLKAKGLM